MASSRAVSLWEVPDILFPLVALVFHCLSPSPKTSTKPQSTILPTDSSKHRVSREGKGISPYLTLHSLSLVFIVKVPATSASDFISSFFKLHGQCIHSDVRCFSWQPSPTQAATQFRFRCPRTPSIPLAAGRPRLNRSASITGTFGHNNKRKPLRVVDKSVELPTRPPPFSRRVTSSGTPRSRRT